MDVQRQQPHGQGVQVRAGPAEAGSWVLVDQATGNVQGVVPPGEFSRRFRPVDLFADVPGLATYLGTVTASDGTALVDLVLDRNPFMLANGPRRAARPHALIVPRSHRDGWSSATAQELTACHTAMTLVAGMVPDVDGGHVVFCANDSAPNLDYLRDLEGAGETLAGGDAGVAVTKNPRQEVQHAHLHAFYAERDRTKNHECSWALAEGGCRPSQRVTGRSAPLSAATPCGWNPDSTGLAADVSAAARPWGGSYCSYQLGVDGPFWVMPALGPSMDEFNRRLAQGPTASRRNPTRTWAGPSTWCGPPWPTPSGSMRHNGPQPDSARVSRLHRPARTERAIAGNRLTTKLISPLIHPARELVHVEIVPPRADLAVADLEGAHDLKLEQLVGELEDVHPLRHHDRAAGCDVE